MKRIGVDDLNTILNIWGDSFPSRLISSYSIGDYYNPQTHDLVPKKEFIEDEIKRKEEQLAENDRAHEASNKYYEGVKERLLAEKESLISQRKKK